jgi:serine acetyltransferase
MNVTPQFSKYGPVSLADSVFLGHACSLGYPKEQTIRECNGDLVRIAQRAAQVKIHDGCIIGNYVCIHEGTHVERETVIEDYVRIGYDSRIGPNCRIMYRAYVCDRVSIGASARIGGFICDGVRIGAHSTVMGNLVHEYSSPHADWWAVDEGPPVVHEHTIVAIGATIVGAVELGPCVYVAAGAIVTKSVPAMHIVCDTNHQVPLSQWTGKKLAPLIEFWESM